MPLEFRNLSIKNSLNHKENKKILKACRDTSFQEVPQSLFLSASLTIEAALVFPLFLFALVGILFFFQVLQVTQVTSGALAATGSLLSLNNSEETSMVAAVGYFYKKVLEEDYPDSIIAGGNAGIGWLGTTLDGEYVDLRIQYQCKFPINLMGVGNIPISQRVRMKKWTGYRRAGQKDTTETETWVYITPSGKVYHRKKDCSYLQLSIRTMGKDVIGDSGYTPCRLCGQESTTYSYYYVTEDGLRYHTRLDCSGLKRTLYLVRLTEAEGRTECSRCGGEG